MHTCLSGHCEYGVRIMHGGINDIAVLVSVAQHHALMWCCCCTHAILMTLSCSCCCSVYHQMEIPLLSLSWRCTFKHLSVICFLVVVASSAFCYLSVKRPLWTCCSRVRCLGELSCGVLYVAVTRRQSSVWIMYCLEHTVSGSLLRLVSWMIPTAGSSF